MRTQRDRHTHTQDYKTLDKPSIMVLTDIGASVCEQLRRTKATQKVFTNLDGQKREHGGPRGG